MRLTRLRHILPMLVALLVPCATLVAALSPTAAAAQTSALDFAVANGHFYTQANGKGGAGGAGFAVTNDGGISFWNEFQRLGGVNALGYPISGRFVWDGFTVQATQRVVMQWRPEVRQVYFVNVYDRIHDLGKDDYLKAFRQTPPIADWSSDTGLPWPQVVARHEALMNNYPKIKAKFFGVPGDPVQMNGLPMAPVVDAGPFYIMRCQRVTIQQWKVDAPASGARAGDVVVTLGGDDGKAAGIYPDPTALIPTAPSGNVARQPFSLSVPHQNVGYSMSATFLFDGGMDADMQQVTSAGFTTVLQQFPWKLLNPSPGQYDWSQSDAIMAASARHGLNVIARVDEQPSWVAVNFPGVVATPPPNVQDYASFLSAMATRYKGQVLAYQIWNEPNLWYEWGGHGKMSATGYTALLKAAYTAIKAADPQAVVIGGNMTPTGTNDGDVAIRDTDFLQQMYQAGAKPYFDVLGAHAAGYGHAPNAAPGSDPANPDRSFYFRRVEDLRAIMVQNGDSGKQMWLTEFGWTIDNVNPAYSWYGVDERTQANYLVQAYQLGKTYPWMGMMSVWNFNFAWMSPPPDEKSFWSIMNPDHTPRQAYASLQAMPK